MMTATSDLRSASGAPQGGAVVATGQANPPWQPQKLAESADDPRWEVIRNARELGPTPGVLDGRSYPAAPDAGGLHHQFYDLLLRLVARGSLTEKLAWSAEMGVQTLVTSEPVAAIGVELLGVDETSGLAAFVYRLVDPAPEAWWPQTTLVASSPYAAYKLVAAQPNPATVAVLPLKKAHVPGATVDLVESTPDRLVVDVSGGGGVLVVRRAFLPLWRAWASGKRLEVLPANLALLGIVVPPGRQQVVLDISSWPETAAGAVGLTVAIGLLLAWRRTRPTPLNPAPGPFVVPSGPGLRSGPQE